MLSRSRNGGGMSTNNISNSNYNYNNSSYNGQMQSPGLSARSIGGGANQSFSATLYERELEYFGSMQQSNRATNISNTSANSSSRPSTREALGDFMMNETVDYHPDTANMENWLVKRKSYRKAFMADRFYEKSIFELHRNAFVAWRKHVFRYISLRFEVMKCFLIRFIHRRFLAWRRISRREALLKKYVKKLWRRKMLIHMNCWKFVTRYDSNSSKLLLWAFTAFEKHVAACRTKKKAWRRCVKYLIQKKSSEVIQYNYRWHFRRLTYWARRKIKKFMMTTFSLKVLHERERLERNRAHFENESIEVILNKMLVDMANLFKTKEGKLMKDNYVNQIKEICNSKDEANQNMFPPAKEMPDLVHIWSIESKAMTCLKRKCIERVVSETKYYFRRKSPPLYECRWCQMVGLYRSQHHFHQSTCLGKMKWLKDTTIYPPRYKEKECPYEFYKHGKVLIDIISKPILAIIRASVGK